MLETSISSVPPSTPAQRWRRRWLWLTAAVASALVAAAVLAGGWWMTHPHVFGPSGGNELSTGLRVVGVNRDVGVVYGDSAEVTLEWGKPHVVENTADATITVVVCTSNQSEPLGSGKGPLSGYCSSVRPPRHLTYTGWDGPDFRGHDYLLLVVNPHRAGVVRVAGVRIHYRQGLRRGTETAGWNVVVQAG